MRKSDEFDTPEPGSNNIVVERIVKRLSGLKRVGIVISLICVWGWWQFHDSTVVLPEGILAPNEPKQTKIRKNQKKQIRFADGYTITPLANFEVKAKVLGKERYFLDRGSDLAPLDLALGWGIMSDQRLVDTLEIRQSARWYMFKNKTQYPAPIREISKSSANMHMVPANDYVSDSLDDIKIGSIALFKGQLVKVDALDGWQWVSSLTRDDTGDGACELFLVESIIVTRE